MGELTYQVLGMDYPDRLLGGYRVLYALSDGRHVVASYVCSVPAQETMSPGCDEVFPALVHETMLFECDGEGNITNWTELYCVSGEDAAEDNRCIEWWLEKERGDG